jgi:DNA replication protein DnaC
MFMEARDEGRLFKLQSQLAAVKLLVVDELGYVPLSQTGADILFEIFSQRHERGSTIVTSNLESYRLKQSKAPQRCATQPVDKAAPAADPETAEIISAS